MHVLVQGLSVPVLGLPIINRPDLMFRMLRSVDFPVDTLLIVHNRDQVLTPKCLEAVGSTS